MNPCPLGILVLAGGAIDLVAIQSQAAWIAGSHSARSALSGILAVAVGGLQFQAAQ